MALNGKYITSREIIDKVFRDNGYTIEIPWQDALEWIGEAMELIAAPMQYIPRIYIGIVEDYRAKLPCDFHKQTQIAGSYGGCYPFPMIETSGSFHPTHETSCQMDSVLNYFNGVLNDPTSLNSAQEAPIGQDIAGNPVFEFDAGDFALNKNNVVLSNPDILNYNQYRLNNDFVFTNYKDGYVFLSYKAFPVDEEGFPLIPDHQRYKEAVTSFIRMKIDYLLWRKGDITADVFSHSEREWLFYVASASGAAKTPSIDKMQAMSNQIKLIQGRFQHSNFFRTLGN